MPIISHWVIGSSSLSSSTFSWISIISHRCPSIHCFDDSWPTYAIEKPREWERKLIAKLLSQSTKRAHRGKLIGIDNASDSIKRIVAASLGDKHSRFANRPDCFIFHATSNSCSSQLLRLHLEWDAHLLPEMNLKIVIRCTREEKSNVTVLDHSFDPIYVEYMGRINHQIATTK